MLSHKVNLGNQIRDIEFVRALYVHLTNREKLIQGSYVYFNYDSEKDSNFLAEWDLLQRVEVNL
jgi:hypothetical protein